MDDALYRGVEDVGRARAQPTTARSYASRASSTASRAANARPVPAGERYAHRRARSVRCRPPTPRARAHAVVQPTPLVCHVRFNNRSREISSRSLIPQPSIYVYDFPRRALFAHVVASPSRASPHTTPRDVARSHRARHAHSSVFHASHSPLAELGVTRDATRDARTRGEGRLGNRSRVLVG